MRHVEIACGFCSPGERIAVRFKYHCQASHGNCTSLIRTRMMFYF